MTFKLSHTLLTAKPLKTYAQPQYAYVITLCHSKFVCL